MTHAENTPVTAARLERLFDLRPTAEHPRLRLAVDWMIELHEGQEYGGPGAAPYTDHTSEVALRVAEWWPGAAAEIVVAALLHDSLEDQPERLRTKGRCDEASEALAGAFGARVAELVEALTNPSSDGLSHPERTEQYRRHVVGLVRATRDAGLVKLADLSTNALTLNEVRNEVCRGRLAAKYGPTLRDLIALADALPEAHPFQGRTEPRRLFEEVLLVPPYARG